MIGSNEFVESARSLVGVPWRHCGRTRLGVDCVGLLVLAAKEAGLDLFQAAGIAPVRKYKREADPILYELVDRHCVRLDAPTPGCVALFRFPLDKYPRHFAVIAGETMIHAEAKSRGCVIEHGYRSLWLKRTTGLYALPGIDYV